MKEALEQKTMNLNNVFFPHNSVYVDIWLVNKIVKETAPPLALVTWGQSWGCEWLSSLSLVCYFRDPTLHRAVLTHWALSFVAIAESLLVRAVGAFVLTFSERPPPRAVLLPPPPRPPLPPRAPPRPRPGRPRSPKLISSWDVMSLAGLRKWWSPDSSGVPCWRDSCRLR